MNRSVDGSFGSTGEIPGFNERKSEYFAIWRRDMKNHSVWTASPPPLEPFNPHPPPPSLRHHRPSTTNWFDLYRFENTFTCTPTSTRSSSSLLYIDPNPPIIPPNDGQFRWQGDPRPSQLAFPDPVCRVCATSSVNSWTGRRTTIFHPWNSRLDPHESARSSCPGHVCDVVVCCCCVVGVRSRRSGFVMQKEKRRDGHGSYRLL